MMLSKLNGIIIQWISQFFWSCGSLLWFYFKWKTIQFDFVISNFSKTSPILYKKLRLFPIYSRFIAKHLHISHSYFTEYLHFLQNFVNFFQVLTVFWYYSIFFKINLFSLYISYPSLWKINRGYVVCPRPWPFKILVYESSMNISLFFSVTFYFTQSSWFSVYNSILHKLYVGISRIASTKLF